MWSLSLQVNYFHETVLFGSGRISSGSLGKVFSTITIGNFGNTHTELATERLFKTSRMRFWSVGTQRIPFFFSGTFSNTGALSRNVSGMLSKTCFRRKTKWARISAINQNAVISPRRPLCLSRRASQTFWAELLEAWLPLTQVKYHENLEIFNTT